MITGDYWQVLPGYIQVGTLTAIPMARADKILTKPTRLKYELVLEIPQTSQKLYSRSRECIHYNYVSLTGSQDVTGE